MIKCWDIKKLFKFILPVTSQSDAPLSGCLMKQWDSWAEKRHLLAEKQREAHVEVREELWQKDTEGERCREEEEEEDNE